MEREPIIQAEYGRGKFTKGVFFTVKGKETSDGAVEFDFHDVMYREVKSFGKKKEKSRSTGRAKKTISQSEGFNMNFSVPNLGSAIGGMAF